MPTCLIFEGGPGHILLLHLVHVLEIKGLLPVLQISCNKFTDVYNMAIYKEKVIKARPEWNWNSIKEN